MSQNAGVKNEREHKGIKRSWSDNVTCLAVTFKFSWHFNMDRLKFSNGLTEKQSSYLMKV